MDSSPQTHVDETVTSTTPTQAEDTAHVTKDDVTTDEVTIDDATETTGELSKSSAGGIAVPGTTETDQNGPADDLTMSSDSTTNDRSDQTVPALPSEFKNALELSENSSNGAEKNSELDEIDGTHNVSILDSHDDTGSKVENTDQPQQLADQTLNSEISAMEPKIDEIDDDAEKSSNPMPEIESEDVCDGSQEPVTSEDTELTIDDVKLDNTTVADSVEPESAEVDQGIECLENENDEQPCDVSSEVETSVYDATTTVLETQSHEVNLITKVKTVKIESSEINIESSHTEVDLSVNIMQHSESRSETAYQYFESTTVVESSSTPEVIPETPSDIVEAQTEPAQQAEVDESTEPELTTQLESQTDEQEESEEPVAETEDEIPVNFDHQTEPDCQAEPEIEEEPETQTETHTEPESETEPEGQAEPETEPETCIDPTVEGDAKPVLEPEVQPEPEADSEPLDDKDDQLTQDEEESVDRGSSVEEFEREEQMMLQDEYITEISEQICKDAVLSAIHEIESTEQPELSQQGEDEENEQIPSEFDLDETEEILTVDVDDDADEYVQLLETSAGLEKIAEEDDAEMTEEQTENELQEQGLLDQNLICVY